MNLGKLAQKARAVVDKKGDRIASGVDKATDLIDRKTKGKYHDRLEKLDDAAARLGSDDREDTAGPDDAPRPPAGT